MGRWLFTCISQVEVQFSSLWIMPHFLPEQVDNHWTRRKWACLLKNQNRRPNICWNWWRKLVVRTWSADVQLVCLWIIIILQGQGGCSPLASWIKCVSGENRNVKKEINQSVHALIRDWHVRHAELFSTHGSILTRSDRSADRERLSWCSFWKLSRVSSPSGIERRN